VGESESLSKVTSYTNGVVLENWFVKNLKQCLQDIMTPKLPKSKIGAIYIQSYSN
jgi:hypothetical protein